MSNYIDRLIELAKRNKEMARLRVEENWTFQAIADKSGISRQRAEQIVKAQLEKGGK